MSSQRAIVRNQLQAFHRALRKQQVIERIAGRQFRVNHMHRMPMIDGE
jgi:hypothetical protein